MSSTAFHTLSDRMRSIAKQVNDADVIAIMLFCPCKFFDKVRSIQ
jgi:hypothetical protein